MRTPAAFRRWLARHCEREQGVWLKFAKRGSAEQTLSYEQARELAIAWGWIDGLINKWDEDFYVLRFTPRRPRSKWSQINREVAEDLLARGEMQPRGLAEVEAARADGRWAAAYPGSASIEEPEDFLAALAESPEATRFYATISRASRYRILWQILDAKRPQTRARRIAKYVAMLASERSP